MVNLRSKYRKSMNDYSIYLDIFFQGRRFNEYLSLYTTKDYFLKSKKRVQVADVDKEVYELVQDLRAKKQIELAGLKNGFTPYHLQTANFIDFAKEVAQKKSNHSYTNAIKHFIKFTGAKKAFNQITPTLLNQFKNYLLTKVSQNTTHAYLLHLSIIWNVAIKKQIVATNPFKHIDLPKKKQAKREYLEFAEIQKLTLYQPQTHLQNQVINAFIFSCFSGLRISDIQKITLNDIDLQSNNIVIKQTKTNDYVYIPLHPICSTIIEKMKVINKIDSNEKRLFEIDNRSGANIILKEVQKQAGITKKLHFHIGRHSFATLSITSGADIYTTQKLLGHKSITQTQIYAKLVDSKRQEAINNMPSIEM